MQSRQLLVRRSPTSYRPLRCSRVNRCRFTTVGESRAAHTDVYDLVCVGGGPAGLSLLAGLLSSPAAAGLRVALIESQDIFRNRSFNASPSTYSNRCSSLTPASVTHLKDIGAWAHVDQTRVQPYQDMHVWDGLTNARISFDWTERSFSVLPEGYQQGNDNIAHMIENSNIIQALLTRLDELSTASSNKLSLFSSTRVESIALPSLTPTATEEDSDLTTLDLSSWPAITLSDGELLRARLLVGADGPSSPVRAFADIQSRGWDYNRHGVVATLRLAEGSSSSSPTSTRTAYQRFLPTGPVALLPLPDNAATLVWSTTPARAALLRRLAPDDFAATVDAAFRLSPADLDYLHSIDSGQRDEVTWRKQHAQFDEARVPAEVESVQDGSVAAFPLRLRHADTYVGERIALVGDAAHTIHPLAGQGLNQGQADAAALTRTLVAALETGQDIGSTLALEPYVSERYMANNTLMGVCDKLHKLYSVESGPLVGLRSLGLRAVNRWGWGKEMLMRAASGDGLKL